MITTRHFIAVTAGIATAAGLVVADATPALAQTFNMKIGLATINDGQHEWAKRYAARVREKSAGRIKVSIFPASQLGSIPRQIEGVQLGTQEMYIGPPEFFVGVDPRFQVLGAPGLFQSTGHLVRTITDPAFRSAFLKLGEKKGLKGVGLFFLAPTAIVTRKPVRTLDDFKGMKIRVFASPIQILPMKRVGATGVPMPLVDVLPALQQGSVDGVFGSVAIFLPFKYYTIAKYMIRTHASYISSFAAVGNRWFARLPAKLKKIVLEEAHATEPEINEWVMDFFTKGEAAWKKNGGTAITFSAADRTEMMRRFSTVGGAVVKQKPEIKQIYDLMVRTANAKK